MKKKINVSSIRERTEQVGLSIKKSNFKPKAFRLSPDDLANLKTISREVSLISRKRISETKVVQALIYLGVSMDKQLIYKALGNLL